MRLCQKIVLDYYFMGEESETAPHIVVKDGKSSAYFSTGLDSKTSQYAVPFVAGAIQELGYKRMLMKSDNEPAIKRLKERVSECLPGVECVPKEASVGDKWFGRECCETGERSIQDTQNFDRTGTVAKLMRNLVC